MPRVTAIYLMALGMSHTSNGIDANPQAGELRAVSQRVNNVSPNFRQSACLPPGHEIEGSSFMKIMKTLAVGAVLVGAGCAKQPDRIAAVEIGANTYAHYSCAQLAAEELKVNQEVTNLSARQKSAANGDAWGVFLIGLPVSSMGGGDQEAAISVAKGKQQAIDRQQLVKRCG